MYDIGVDMVDIDRIKKSIKRKTFLMHFFGYDELKMFRSKSNYAQSVAANFCAKEAFVKVCNFKIANFRFKNIQILRDDNGKPYFKFDKNIEKIINEKGLAFSVSVTHTKKYACATVLCYSK